MGGALIRSGLRSLARHPWQAGLSVLGIALGVAVVVSIDLANASARRAFALSASAVAGRATHEVTGGPSGVPEDLYRRLRVELGLRASSPVVEGFATAPAFPGRTFRLLGVDPFAEAPFAWRPSHGRSQSGRDLAGFLTRPGTVLLAAPTAAELALRPGDTLEIKIGSARERVELVGLVEPHDDLSRQGLQDLLVMDVSVAQELLGSTSRLSRIDLTLGPEPDSAVMARIRQTLPPGVALTRASSRAQMLEQLTRAFHVNLTALSLLALAVGMFLIHSTMTFSVVQRRGTIGLLRALGVTRREVVGLILGEALVIGLVATALGIGVGVLLAHGLLGLVTRTINDLYFVVSVRELAVSPRSLVKAAALGVGATLLAATAPALEATRAAPRVALARSTLEAGMRRLVPRSALAGLALLLLSAALLAWPSGSLLLAYGAVFLLLLGFALLTPGLITALTRGLEPLVSRLMGTLGRLAARGVVQTLSRTAVAAAALTVAVAATIGVGIMVTSFRATVRSWLETTLQADVYVSPPSLISSRTDSTLDPALVGRLRQAPGAASVSTHRGVMVESPIGRIRVVAIDVGSPEHLTFRFKEGAIDAVWPAFQTGGAVIVSEPFAYRFGSRIGGSMRLGTDRGDRTFPIAGVFYDYASDQGVVVMSRRTYEQFWDDRGISALAIRAPPAVSVDGLIETLRRVAGPDQPVLIRSNRALRDASLEVFDRTFAITVVLRLLAMLVAGVGILSALMALQLERTREVGVLRVLGLTPARVWTLSTIQSGLIGLMAGLLAIPLGLLLALVLVFVINRRSFGWTLFVTVEPSLLLQALVLALCAATLAGAIPGLRMARGSAAAALRDE